MTQDETPLPPLPARLDPRQEPGPRSRSRSQERARARRGRRVAVLATRTLAALLSLVILSGTAVATTFYNRIKGDSGTAIDIGTINQTTEAPASGSAEKDPGEDVNILVAGNDSREGYSEEQLAQLGIGFDPTLNTDTLMLIHIPASGAKASVVSFPRDAWVNINGKGKGKINSAYADGYYSLPESAPAADKEKAGQAALIKTVNQLTGLVIDHYVEVTLLGFLKLTQALDGVTVNLCDDTSDPNYTGLELSKGTHTLSGIDALRFVRQRHGLPNGDLDRIKRQQYFIGAVIRKMLDQNLLNLGKLSKIVDALTGTIKYDPGLDPLLLAEQLREISAGNVEFRTVPLSPQVYGMEGGQSVVLLQDDATIKQFFASLDAAIDATPSSSSAPASSSAAKPTVAPAQVAVDVWNATGRGGQATSTGNELAAQGFQVTSVNTADAVQAPTTIAYGAGQEAQANTLAALIPGSTVTADPNLTSGSVKLTLGSSFNGLGQATASTSSAAVPPPDQTAQAGGCVN